MNDEENRLLRENALLFFGAITADLSHEIRNSMAIAGEISGLMEDILHNKKKGSKADIIKLKELAARITAQAKKGNDFISELNLFAHSVDEPSRTFDLIELIEQITSLTKRKTFRRGVSLETELADKPLTITSDPFRLQQAVFICIQLALAASQENDAITLAANASESGARIVVAGAAMDEAESFESELSFLAILTRTLGGTVEHASLEGGRQSLTLSIPETLPDAGDG